MFSFKQTKKPSIKFRVNEFSCTEKNHTVANTNQKNFLDVISY